MKSGVFHSSRNVLLVDDDVVGVRVLARAISGARPSWSVHTVNDVRSAIKRLTFERYDAFITDLEMPEVDGFALLRAAVTRFPSLGRVVLSGSSPERRAQAEVDAHAVLQKPALVADLVHAVELAVDDLSFVAPGARVRG